MANLQLEAFGEPFASPSALLRFKKRNYKCPFDSRISKCDKPNKGTIRYGNCSAQVGTQKRIICPRRFYEYNFKVLKDIKRFIWGAHPSVKCYDELGVQITTAEGDKFHYGNLDWILVRDIDKNDFCGIEIQTDATTGTGAFKTAIADLAKGQLEQSYSFGLNTLASFKGFLPQFIFKGQLFDDWKRPYCAVIQDELWLKFIKKFRVRFREISSYKTETFIFFVYSLLLNPSNNKYYLSPPKIYSMRWIDLLFSFSVESDLLIDLAGIKNRIQQKILAKSPIITIM